MTINTLRYIHDMLLAEEEKSQQLLDYIRKERNEAEHSDDTFRYETLCKECDELRLRHSKAYDALQDFCCHEFR